ncbi:MAG: PilZ domain-containing protein [Armatimonadetes bacterium]|nr:PilZ domain-containing protein [Armatimonadota bacterium]
MTRISPREYVGTRARLAGVADGAELAGWIEEVSADKLCVLIPICSRAGIGDQFRLEMIGKSSVATVDVTLEKLVQFDAALGAQVIGNNAVILESEWVCGHFAVLDEPEVTQTAVPFRCMVNAVTARLKTGSGEVDCLIRDVSNTGFGMTLTETLETGSQLEFVVEAPVASIRGEGSVQYCRPWRDTGYRAGVKITRIDRLDRPRWEQYVAGA